MYLKIFFFSVLCTLFGHLACSSGSKITAPVTDAPKPVEQYTPEMETPLLSYLSIPVSINIEDLVRLLNNQTSKALYEDYSYSDNNNDGLMLNAWKSEPITMSLSGNTIKYRIPLKLWMKKQLVVGEAEAEGTLALALKTTYQLKEDWKLVTQTSVEYHEWLAKPVLKTGLGNINIEPVANIALNRSKKTITQSIDQFMAEQLDLKGYMQEAWTALQTPTLLSEEYKMWIKTTPIAVAMTPLQSDWNSIKATIAVQCLNDVSFGEKPYFRENAALPNLQYLNAPSDDFQMHLSTDVPYPEAEKLAKKNMIGQVFESGKQKVRVEDIQLWGNDNRLVINTRLSGSFNGNIYFMGKPVFNSLKNQIEVQDVDFHVQTRNFLMKSAAWIFQGPIKKKLTDSMVFPLGENIAELKKTVQGSLTNYQIQPGVTLNGTIDSIAVTDTHLTPSSIRVNLFSKGKVNVDVKGL
jgi:hypothetical protein